MEVGDHVVPEAVEEVGQVAEAAEAHHLLLERGDDQLLAAAAREVGALAVVVGVPRARELQRLGAVHVLAARR